MSYTVKGSMQGLQLAVTWDNGKLTGSKFLLDLLNAECQVFNGRGYFIGTYFANDSDLKENGLVIYSMVESFLDTIDEVIGEVPTLPNEKDLIY